MADAWFRSLITLQLSSLVFWSGFVKTLRLFERVPTREIGTVLFLLTLEMAIYLILVSELLDAPFRCKSDA